MTNIFPTHIKAGDEIRVIAPSSSLGIIGADIRAVAEERFSTLGLKLSFGKNVSELDEFNSSSIESRVEDLHSAFTDPNVRGVMCVIGGFNSNQLLPYIDWELIRQNPKPFIGYSDITVLHNAILSRTGVVTYLGPAYSTFGQKKYFEHTLEYFEKCLMQEDVFVVEPAAHWSDDAWYINQEERTLVANTGPFVVQPGQTEGELVGGNLSSLALLFGTEYMPRLENKILCLEDDEESDYKQFDRLFEALLMQPGARELNGILLGRFQRASAIDRKKIDRLIAVRPQLRHIPILADLDFGHTSPLVTFPIGGTVVIDTSSDNPLQVTRF